MKRSKADFFQSWFFRGRTCCFPVQTMWILYNFPF